MLKWILFADFVVILFVLMLGLAIQTDRIDQLRRDLKTARKQSDQHEKALNRRQICDTMSKEWYESELDEMRTRVGRLQYTVDHQRGIIASKNHEIIRLKTKGDNNGVDVSL